MGLILSDEEISLRAISELERAKRSDRARATPFTCIRIQRIERNARAPFSMFSSLSNMCRVWCNAAAGGGPERDGRAISNAVPSTISARNRWRRARMHLRIYVLST